MTKLKKIEENGYVKDVEDSCNWQTPEEAGIKMQVLSGYLFKISALTKEDSFSFSYHGNDIPPSNAQYVADFDNDGFIVAISDPSNLELVDGWISEEIYPEIGDTFYQGDGYNVMVLEVLNDNNVILVCKD